MAIYAGKTGLYKTASGVVAAVTTAHYDSNGDAADVAADAATTVDIITVGYNPTRVAGVDVAGTATFAARLTNTVGTFWVPA